MLIQSVFMPLLTLFQDGISQVFTFSKIHNLHRLAQYPRKTKIAPIYLDVTSLSELCAIPFNNLLNLWCDREKQFETLCKRKTTFSFAYSSNIYTFAAELKSHNNIYGLVNQLIYCTG